MMHVFLSGAALAGALATGGLHAQGVLEIPASNSTQSGIGTISGWHCSAGRIEIVVDDGAPILVGSHTARADTASVCGRADTGFSLLFNWNVLPTQCFGCRFHRVVALADGVPFADTQFQAENFGTEFLSGKSAQYPLRNFPDPGNITWLRWDQAMQNFAINLTAKNQFSNSGTYYGALRVGAQNPACGPFPPGRVFKVTQGTFVVQASGGQLSLSAQYVDGGTCTLAAVPFQKLSNNDDDGYLAASFDKAATAACPEFPEGLEVSVNGQRLVADSKDACRTAHLMGAQ